MGLVILIKFSKIISLFSFYLIIYSNHFIYLGGLFSLGYSHRPPLVVWPTARQLRSHTQIDWSTKPHGPGWVVSYLVSLFLFRAHKTFKIASGGKHMNNFIIYPRIGILHMFSLREKYSNTEFLLVRIFLYLVRIQGNTNQKKLRIWTLFTHMF